MFFYPIVVVFTAVSFLTFLRITNRLGYIRAIWPTALAISWTLLCLWLVGGIALRWEHVAVIVGTALPLWVLTQIARARRPRNDRP